MVALQVHDQRLLRAEEQYLSSLTDPPTDTGDFEVAGESS